MNREAARFSLIPNPSPGGRRERRGADAHRYGSRGEHYPGAANRSTRRRVVIAAAAWPAVAWAGAVFGQSKKPPILIGWLRQESREEDARWLTAFKEELAALGWKEGSRVVIEERWANGRIDRLQPLAEELAARKPAVIVAGPMRSAPVAAKAAPATPIVMITSGDPVAAGVVASLARPGGTITGVTGIQVDVTEKFLELLLTAVPKLKRVGFLTDPRNPNRAKVMDAVRRSAAQHPVEARMAEATSPEEIERAILRLAKDGAQALVVTASATFITERRRIVGLALAQRWPLVAGRIEFAEEGGLLTYGSDRLGLFRRAAYYVDRILKGAKPGELPIEQPTKFALVVNLKTAKVQGITIPQTILVRADKVIE